VHDLVFYPHLACGIVNHKISASGHTALAHSTGHNSGMTGCPAAGRQNTFGSIHPCDIFRRSLHPDQDNRFTLLLHGYGIFS